MTVLHCRDRPFGLGPEVRNDALALRGTKLLDLRHDLARGPDPKPRNHSKLGGY